MHEHSRIGKVVALTFLLTILTVLNAICQRKAVFIILDGISADVIEKIETPVLDEIAEVGGYTRAYLGGEKGSYSESPTISAVGYNTLLTGTWAHKHNVYDNDIEAPNYHYWNIFRIAAHTRPGIHTAIFSSWVDNRTKLIGEGLPEAGNVKLDYAFDGFELDEEKFPHTRDRIFMFNIDEHVSKEAGRYIAEKGPDLSWVYLEFTDDVGHMYGDSPPYFDAVRKADVQVGRIWEAVKARQRTYGEEWMIVITTDHGRNAEGGKNHGGQTDRERTTWITTNLSDVNARFSRTPATTDIMPSILRFMRIGIPRPTLEELDGVPFTGAISITNLSVTRRADSLALSWDVIDPRGDVRVMISTTNKFREGGKDEYILAGITKVDSGRFIYKIPVRDTDQPFFKIRVEAPSNLLTAWSVDKNHYNLPKN